MHHRSELDNFRFCPKCGIGLESKALKDGEPARLVCPGCDFIFYLDPKVAACTICMVDGGIVRHAVSGPGARGGRTGGCSP